MSRKNHPLFKDIKLSWGQAGLFKLSTISFGILLATYFTEVLSSLTPLIWVTFLVPGVYILSIYFKD